MWKPFMFAAFAMLIAPVTPALRYKDAICFKGDTTSPIFEASEGVVRLTFRGQQSDPVGVSQCTGFIVQGAATTYLLTAGHCTRASAPPNTPYEISALLESNVTTCACNSPANLLPGACSNPPYNMMINVQGRVDKVITGFYPMVTAANANAKYIASYSGRNDDYDVVILDIGLKRGLKGLKLRNGLPTVDEAAYVAHHALGYARGISLLDSANTPIKVKSATRVDLATARLNPSRTNTYFPYAYYSVDADLDSGASGSPVFAANTQTVIGMMVVKYRNQNIFIDSKLILDLVTQKGTATMARDFYL